MGFVLQVLLLAMMCGCGLNGGLFFIFSNTAMPALFQLPVEEGIKVMQHFNRVILNPLFFLVFVGTALLSAVLHRQ